MLPSLVIGTLIINGVTQHCYTSESTLRVIPTPPLIAAMDGYTISIKCRKSYVFKIDEPANAPD